MFSSKKYTLNFDGSYKNQSKEAGAGCIIRDSNGNFIVAASYKLNLPDCNIAIAEAIGLRNGLKLAQSKYLNLNYIKGDNEEVINHVLGVALRKPEPTLAGIIKEIKVLFGQGFAEIERISRDANKVADKFAYIGSLLDGVSSKVFDYFEIPPQVIYLIDQEKETNIGNGEGSSGSSLASNIGKAGAAVAGVAGVAMLAWRVSKLFSDDTSSSSRPSQPSNSWKSLTDTLASFSQSPTSNTPKPTPDFTLQYFGSDRNQLEKASAGCIIKNGREFIVAGAYNLDDHYPDACHIAIAEAIALLKGLELAKGNNVRLNVIQGRNKQVRNLVLGVEESEDLPGVKKKQARIALDNFIRQIRFAIHDQGVDVDKCLKLIDEESIKVAQALSIEGRRLEKEEMVYRSVSELPTMVWKSFNIGSID